MYIYVTFRTHARRTSETKKKLSYTTEDFDIETLVFSLMQ